jgi:cytochrome P450
MESWNEVVNFTLKAVNSRSPLKRDGDLKVDENAHIGSDMLSRWTAVNNTDPLKMSTRDVIVHLSANVFAGSGTTAITLRAVIYYLCKNHSKMKKVINELDANQHHLSNPITYKEATNHLPYMNAVLKEAMRIHPSTGLLLERHVPAGGATICGEHIPGGTIVGINAWVLHYDEKVFPEPEKFIPERWLDSDKKKLAEMEKSFFSFGAGSRTCVGKNISLMEMTKIIPQMLREYEIILAHPEKDWKMKNRWFVQQSGLDCILKKRERR